MSKLSREEILQLIPAYVVNALEESERIDVEALLATDTEAQDLLEQYQQIEDLLPLMAVYRAPSPDLKGRLLAQLQPHIEDEVEVDEVVEYEQFTNEVIELPEKPKKRKRVSLRRRLMLPVAAALVVAVVGIALLITSLTQPDAQTIFYELSQIPESDRVDVAPSLTEEINGELIISPDGEQGVMRIMDLPEIDPDQAFQLWMVDESGVADGGLYQQEKDVYALFILVPNTKPIREYIRFGVSLEPAQGSPLGNKASGPGVFAVTIPASDEVQYEQ